MSTEPNRAKRPRGRPVATAPEPIPDTPENIIKTVVRTRSQSERDRMLKKSGPGIEPLLERQPQAHLQPRAKNRHLQPRAKNRHLQPRAKNRHLQPRAKNRHLQPRAKNRHLQPRAKNRHLQPRAKNRHLQPRAKNHVVKTLRHRNPRVERRPHQRNCLEGLRQRSRRPRTITYFSKFTSDIMDAKRCWSHGSSRSWTVSGRSGQSLLLQRS